MFKDFEAEDYEPQKSTSIFMRKAEGDFMIEEIVMWKESWDLTLWQKVMRMEAERCENTTWLSLKMDKGMMNQGMQL